MKESFKWVNCLKLKFSELR